MEAFPKMTTMPPPADGVRRHDEEKSTKLAARSFEAEFLTQAVEEMLNTVKVGTFGGGEGEEMWRSFLARAYADQIAARDITGLAGSVERAIGAYRDGGRT